MLDPTRSPVMLCPGIRVLRRDAGHWQIGLHSSRRLLVTASPEIDPLIEGLGVGPVTFPATAPAHRLARRLVERGLLVDEATVTGAVATGSRAARAQAAAVAAYGDGSTEILRRRAAAVLRVEADQEDRTVLDTLLQPAGVRRDDSADAPDLALLVRLGEVRRSALDDLIRDSTPHLLVRALDGQVVVGPFVVPGRSACLRCVDARRSESDPRHPLLVEQYARHPGDRRQDGVAEPVDPTLWALALASAAHDVVRFLDGRQPLTWSATRTWTLDADPLDETWCRHPRCGCSWADGLVV